MISNIDNLKIFKDMTIKDAMRQIERGSCKTAFLVENNILIGSLTDGDIRRHLLNGGNLNDNVCQIVNYQPQFFKINEKINYRKYMVKNILQAIPIVDEQMNIVRIEVLAEGEEEIRRIDESVPVIMMAGGLGTRLKPYTDIIPKPLIPIGSKTISEHIFDKFVSYGCEKFFMILNYKKGLIEAYFNELHKYHDLHYIEEPFFMGTAGGIQLVKEACIDNFFLVNCDILVDCNYHDIWKKHTDNKYIITMVLAKKQINLPYGTVTVNKDELVSELVEKPNLTYYVNTGLYLCNAEVFAYITENEEIDMPTLISRCIDAGENVGQVTIDENNWYDMGQPEGVKLMKQKFSFIE